MRVSYFLKTGFLGAALLLLGANSVFATPDLTLSNANDQQSFIDGNDNASSASLTGSSIGSLSTLAFAGGQEFTTAISRHQNKLHSFNKNAGSNEIFFGEADDVKVQKRMDVVMGMISQQFGMSKDELAAMPQFWSSDFHRKGKVGSSNGFDTYDYDLNGFAAGIDMHFGGDLSAGFASGYSRASTTFESLNRTSTAIDAYQAALYATYEHGKLAVDTNLSFNMFENSSERNVMNSNTMADAKGTGYQVSWNVSASGHETMGNYILTPMAGFTLTTAHRNHMDENGAGMYNLSSGASSHMSLKPMLGIDIVRHYRVLGGMTLTPEVYGIYRYEVMDAGENANTSLNHFSNVGLGNSTASLSRHTMQLGSALAMKMGENLTGKLQFDSDLQPSSQSYSAVFKLNYVW